VAAIGASVKNASARRAVFATAGHVDHGKTALVRALTGTDTDRLPEEKRRGITIELGFAELPDTSGTGVSFIDVPGHRRLVHAMIAGASGVDALLLVVAADDGVMPQTREHLHVAKLLGVFRVLVAITKADLVDDETLTLGEADVRDVLASMGLDAVEIVRTSAQSGAGIDALRDAVERLAASLPDPAATSRALLPVDRVFTVKGAGAVITGTLTRGRLQVGQAIYVHGAGGAKAGVCRGLEVHGRAASFVDAPSRVAVNLGRLGKDDLARGEVLSTQAELPVTRRLDVALRLVPGAEPDVEDGSPVVFHAGTARAAARVYWLGDGVACITLEEPLVAIGGMGFVLRGFAEHRERGAVVGGGAVLDAEAAPLPPRRDREARARRATWLEMCRKGNLRDAATNMMDVYPRALRGASLENRLGVEPGAIATWFGKTTDQGVVTVDGGQSWTTRVALERLGDVARNLVEAHQTAAPHERGASLETIRATLAERAGREAADAAIARGIDAARLRLVDAGVLCTPEFAARAHQSSDAVAEAVLAQLERARFDGLEEAAVVAAGTDAAALRAALGRLAATSRARRLGGLWFAERTLGELRGMLRERFGTGATLTVADFKELCGVSRKQAIPLLEQLDREGTTRRQGDVRLAGPLLSE
jgi:selenocysteine-specific elongation factor